MTMTYAFVVETPVPGNELNAVFALDIVGLARATGMTMEELAQYLMHIKKGGSPFCSAPKEDMENAPEEN